MKKSVLMFVIGGIAVILAYRYFMKDKPAASSSKVIAQPEETKGNMIVPEQSLQQTKEVAVIQAPEIIQSEVYAYYNGASIFTPVRLLSGDKLVGVVNNNNTFTIKKILGNDQYVSGSTVVNISDVQIK